MTRERRVSDGEPASGVARSLLRRLDPSGEGYARAEAVRAWRAAAGEEVAAHAMGFTLRESELVVFVDSSVWANELAALSEHYRQAVNARLGKESVGSVRFAVSRMVREEKVWERIDREAVRREADDKVPTVPATESELAQLRMMAAGIHDDRLREAVITAATRELEWRKGREARNASQNAAGRARRAGADAEHKDSW